MKKGMGELLTELWLFYKDNQRIVESEPYAAIADARSKLKRLRTEHEWLREHLQGGGEPDFYALEDAADKLRVAIDEIAALAIFDKSDVSEAQSVAPQTPLSPIHAKLETILTRGTPADVAAVQAVLDTFLRAIGTSVPVSAQPKASTESGTTAAAITPLAAILMDMEKAAAKDSKVAADFLIAKNALEGWESERDEQPKKEKPKPKQQQRNQGNRREQTGS